MLYKVRVAEDVYVGTAEEVVAFMMRAEGAPGPQPADFMRSVAARVREQMHLEGVAVDDASAFLESLGSLGVLAVDVLGEPSDERVDPREALGDGPLAYGPGVDPGDVDV